MDDMSSRLNEILSDPGSMEKLRSLAAMFGSTQQQEGPTSAPQQRPPQSSQNQQQAQSAAPAVDPDLMRSVMKLAPAFSRMRQEDSSTQLLRALRPFLGESRQKRLDEALRILQLMRMLPYLRNSGIFQSIF